MTRQPPPDSEGWDELDASTHLQELARLHRGDCDQVLNVRPLDSGFELLRNEEHGDSVRTIEKWHLHSMEAVHARLNAAIGTLLREGWALELSGSNEK
jgi:hypothetical protein